MANDVPEILGKVNENENRSKISISTESKEDADKLFSGLSAGRQIEMPGVLMLACLETNMALNGRWSLTPEVKG
jgi:hypothetical protein